MVVLVHLKVQHQIMVGQVYQPENQISLVLREVIAAKAEPLQRDMAPAEQEQFKTGLAAVKISEVAEQPDLVV